MISGIAVGQLVSLRNSRSLNAPPAGITNGSDFPDTLSRPSITYLVPLRRSGLWERSSVSLDW
jgi:hypothetical protein